VQLHLFQICTIILRAGIISRYSMYHICMGSMRRPNYSHLPCQVFNEADLNESGTLDAKELGSLVRGVLPHPIRFVSALPRSSSNHHASIHRRGESRLIFGRPRRASNLTRRVGRPRPEGLAWRSAEAHQQRRPGQRRPDQLRGVLRGRSSGPVARSVSRRPHQKQLWWSIR
jgi:hypothetical protein